MLYLVSVYDSIGGTFLNPSLQKDAIQYLDVARKWNQNGMSEPNLYILSWIALISMSIFPHLCMYVEHKF